VRLRPSRCRAIIGENIPTPEIQRVLEAHEVQVRPDAGGVAVAGVGGEPVLHCTVPAHRPDLEREIDLIEEVARTHGLDKLPVHEKVAARVAPPQASERAVRDLGSVLNGLGFFEAVTFTFVSAKAAKPFLPAGLELLQVCDDRRAADPVLRPSAIPSLLACRRANQDRGADEEAGVGEAGVRLYEVSSVFAQEPAPPKGSGVPGGPSVPARGRELERVNLALVADCAWPVGAKAHEQRQAGLRLVRGAVEAAARALGGEGVRVEIAPEETPFCPAYDPATLGAVLINGQRAGFIGLLSPAVQAQAGLETPVACAEIELSKLVALYPPKSTVKALPAFPAIERDLSLIVPEAVRWAQIDALVGGLGVGRLEAWSFVTAYRGQQTGPGRKSVTLRMRFRDPARTLTHDEVSPQVETIAAAAKKDLGAEIRTA
jgi:phenylalanyl-tRNA synthetase beta chain